MNWKATDQSSAGIDHCWERGNILNGLIYQLKRLKCSRKKNNLSESKCFINIIITSAQKRFGKDMEREYTALIMSAVSTLN